MLFRFYATHFQSLYAGSIDRETVKKFDFTMSLAELLARGRCGARGARHGTVRHRGRREVKSVHTTPDS